MGYQGKRVLVVMTNSDVYYISTEAALKLEMKREGSAKTFRTTDVKSGSNLVLQIANISATVEEAYRG